MMAATFNGNPRATIISCYSPTNVSEETELVTFYDELSSLVRSIPKHNMLVIGGDMNAQIGKNGNNKYSLHNTSNRYGQHLTDFMIENRLACLNANYQKGEGKLWTYPYANNCKAQIDYVLINKKWKNSAMNCEAYSSFEGMSSDHRKIIILNTTNLFLYGIKYSYQIQIIFKPIYLTQRLAPTIPSQNGSRSKSNEGLFYTPEIFRTSLIIRCSLAF